ncbi:LytR/AlgR family response regulator transcription factor [Prolixibacter denitrificans]|uniref:DNA-binding response regulator n=1 Tax=Prolixibacter denitrificans TaxID=1541063 RepID=A0A2P8CL54_9BACT|nr:LytTR family DNA-binding domain-containing protein [Prolixibacter denitrificans]PSK85702.1 two-component system LytT family response regulator [Prolixibacter denitrificans]GET20321.1 DNA-binding response regulator [Prolixibacter denitrificans]
MLRTVIIDDDQLSRTILKKTFEKCFENVILEGEADSVASGFELINRVHPNLVFLDIKLPDGTGFDLIEKLENSDFKLIFTTAYSEYAIKAFKYSAFDYIVKPIVPDDIKASLNRINQVSTASTLPRVRAMRDNLFGSSEEANATIALPELNGFSIVRIDDIERCEGERNYSRIFFKDGTETLVSRTLMEFENLLAHHGFSRIHRSHLINLKNVVRYLKSGGGMVEMTSGEMLKVSSKYKDELLNRLLHNRL